MVFDDLDVVAEASNGAEAIRLCAELRPDVILMDSNLPDVNGLDTTRTICKGYPGIKIIILSGLADEDDSAEALAAGAVGYITKNVRGFELADAIRAACIQ